MKALTVWQPWASLIAMGAKPYEFRGWKPPKSVIGERIAIHAGTRKVNAADLRAIFYSLDHGITPCLHRELAMPILEAVRENPGAVTRAHIVCTAILGEPKRGEECAAEFGQDFGNDSDREGTFNWGWPLTDIKQCEPPIPWRGMQGLWTLPDGVIEGGET